MNDGYEQARWALLSRILDFAADAIIAIDENQAIVFFSRAVERLYGYGADEVLGRSPGPLLPPAVIPAHGHHVRRFASTEGPAGLMADSVPARGRHKDGSEFAAEVSIARLSDQDQTLLVAIVRDVTRRQHVEEALAESEERYRSIVSAMAEGIVMQDAEGHIVACNESAERILGLSHEHMVGLTSYDLHWRAVHADGSPAAGDDHPIVVTRRTGQPQHDVIMGVHRPDGALVWASVNTQPLFHPSDDRPYAVVASFADVTEQRRGEVALRESEARYRALFEDSIDGVLLTAPTGEILAANPEACRLLRRTEGEICRVGRAGIVDASDDRLPTVLEERRLKGRLRSELTLVRGDGTRFPAEVSSGLFRDRDGNLRTSMVFRDITERVEAYQLLEQRVALRTQELTALLEVGRDVVSTLALAPLLNTILTHLKTVVDYTGAGDAILKDGGMDMVGYAGPIPCSKVVGALISLDRDSAYTRVLSEKASVIIPDLGADLPWLRAPWECQDEEPGAHLRPVHSCLGVPLIARGELIGVLRIDHVEPDYFTQHHAQRALAFANQAAVAIDNARLYEQAQRAATIEERQRLSRELHDSVSEALYAIVLGARKAALEQRGPQAAADPLQYVLSLAETALAEMRALIFALRPDALEMEGLVAALSRQRDLLSARYGIAMDTALGEEPALPPDVKEALYRIAQEALNNITSHAQAHRVAIHLRQEPGSVRLEISDDGQGFDPSEPRVGHLGLHSMRERAERLNAAFEVQSAPGRGTTVRIRVPLRDDTAPE